MFAVLFVLLHSAFSARSMTVTSSSSVVIAAFNVRVFGVSKMDNRRVIEKLVQIVLKYDVILIQEIREKSGKSIRTFLSEVNKIARDRERGTYRMVLSPRLGRTSSKEEYAYLYRHEKLSLVSHFMYPDVDDVFEREPFIVRFKSKTLAVQDFAIIGIHTSPRDAQNEISNLSRAYDAVYSKWRLADVIIMGDFNAGCSYVDDWREIELARNGSFYWLIDNSQDTTSHYSECAYDRIVVAGEKMLKAVQPGSGKVYHFDEEMKLDLNTTLGISDHYPVSMEILSAEITEDISSSMEVHIKDQHINALLVNSIHLVYRLRSLFTNNNNFTVVDKFKKSGAYSEIRINKKLQKSEATNYLYSMTRLFPGFVSLNQANKAERLIKKLNEKDLLPNGYGKYKTLRDYYKKMSEVYEIGLCCNVMERNTPQCSLLIVKPQFNM